MLRAVVAERGIDKRALILDAAVHVFARKGFHAARVGDVAEEAGVAHGLLYHYFRSKDEVLETIFRETWSDLLAELARIEESREPLPEQLTRFAGFYLGSWLRAPDLIRVLVREVARSPELTHHVDEISSVFAAITRLFAAAQERGELRADTDARLTTWQFYGSLEAILTGWVLGQLPDGEEDVERAVQTVVEVVCRGLAPVDAALSA
jgi:TetR/AcrR family fatty acid metabolism transcriptional regulator